MASQHDNKAARTTAASTPTAIAAASESKSAGNVAAALIPARAVAPVLLSEIAIDYAWNARSLDDVNGSADGVRDTTARAGAEQGEDIRGLAANIASAGQDTPIVLRRVYKGRTLGGMTTALPYEVIAGFRRITAITMLNRPDSAEERKPGSTTIIPGVPDGHILGELRECTPQEARLINLRENTSRNNLKTPDLVLQVTHLQKQGMTQVAIAQGLSITQSFVSKLLQVASLPMPILLHWRNGNASPIAGLSTDKVWPRVPMPDLGTLAELAKKDGMTEGAIIKRYVDMLLPAEALEGSGEGGSGKKDAATLARIKDFAAMMARFVKGDFVQPGTMNWNKVIGPKKAGFPVDSGTNDAGKVAALCSAAESAYKEALAFGESPAAQ